MLSGVFWTAAIDVFPKTTTPKVESTGEKVWSRKDSKPKLNLNSTPLGKIKGIKVPLKVLKRIKELIHLSLNLQSMKEIIRKLSTEVPKNSKKAGKVLTPLLNRR